jgi:predicted transcriptional regulator
MKNMSESSSTKQPKVQKRGYLDIIACILEVTQIEAKKSHIVYKANLNFPTTTQYLQQLTAADLLTAPFEGKRLYKTTAKGLEFLDRYTALANDLPPSPMHSIS